MFGLYHMDVLLKFSKFKENWLLQALNLLVKLYMLKENSLKRFPRQSGDTYFQVLKSKSKSKFKEKK